MGFLSGIFSATVKAALTPIAIAKDVVNVATGEDAEATKNLLESAAKDTLEAIDDLDNGDVL